MKITFSQLIDELGGVLKVAAFLKLKYGTVKAMYRRDRVAPEYASQIVAMAKKQEQGKYNAEYILAMYAELRKD